MVVFFFLPHLPVLLTVNQVNCIYTFRRIIMIIIKTDFVFAASGRLGCLYFAFGVCERKKNGIPNEPLVFSIQLHYIWLKLEKDMPYMYGV